MLSLENLKSETEEARALIDQKWEKFTGNARDGHKEQLSSWRLLASSSEDGHLDDTDPDNPYILFLPNDFVFPGGRFIVQFYWDSYFIILSLLKSNKFELAKGMVENCLYLVEHHGMVINSRKRWAAGSQLPFLSEMIKEVYIAKRDKAWLQTVLPTLYKEYKNYWLNEEHLTCKGLSRYHAPPQFPKEQIPTITLDNESTWDLSARFDASDILQLLPVDLNCNLFGYEKNFAFFSSELSDMDSAEQWRDIARKRAQLIDDTMWDSTSGLYYDYNYVAKQRKEICSLATYFPLFYGMSSKDKAKAIVSNISLFEHEFGLSTCDVDYGYTDRQWNYPVGWAPLHWIVFKGLMNYGYIEAANRIALKWLGLNLEIYKRTGNFYEKYDVVRGSHEVLTDRYKNQEGFGWTNAIFDLLIDELLTSSQI